LFFCENLEEFSRCERGAGLSPPHEDAHRLWRQAAVLQSPNCAQRVAENSYPVYAYSAKDGVLGKRLAELPWENSNSHPIVTAQWSSVKYVAQWTEAIQKIKDHPLPEPVVRPGAPHEQSALAVVPD
jgi:hypothetical protein